MAVHRNGRWKAEQIGRTFYIQIQLNKEEKERDFRIVFHQDEAGITYSAAEKKMVFFRKNWMTGEAEEKTADIGTLEELEIWSDYSSMEIFVNEGQTVFSSRIYPKSGKTEIIIEGNLQEKDMRICKIINNKKEEKRDERTGTG